MFHGRLIALLTYCAFYRPSLQLTGPNVCRKSSGGKFQFYCCFNHYFENGQCKACSPGTTSTDGIFCHPCPENVHGNACKHPCDCNFQERCDPVLGCIDNMTSSQTTSGPHLLAVSTNTNDKITSTEIAGDTYTLQSHKRSNFSTSVVSVERTRDSRQQRPNSENTINLVYYFVIAGGIVGWCVFCFAIIRFIYRRSKRKFQKTAEHPNVRIQENSPNRRSSETPTENIYYEIEDIPTPEVTMKRHDSYLSVIGSEMSQESVADENNAQCVVHNAENSRSEKTLSSSSTSSEGSQCSDNRPNIEGYLHPYTSLAKENAEENKYNKCNNNGHTMNDKVLSPC